MLDYDCRAEGAMHGEKHIDAMIEAGWQVLESDFDPEAFGAWRKKATLCVNALLSRHGSYGRDSSVLPFDKQKKIRNVDS